jgi:hypothetical protein
MSLNTIICWISILYVFNVKSAGMHTMLETYLLIFSCFVMRNCRGWFYTKTNHKIHKYTRNYVNSVVHLLIKIVVCASNKNDYNDNFGSMVNGVYT